MFVHSAKERAVAAGLSLYRRGVRRAKVCSVHLVKVNW